MQNEPTFDEKLEELRKCQDENDSDFLATARKSIEITKAIFYLKSAEDISFVDKQREKEVLNVPDPLKGIMRILLELRKTEALLYVASSGKANMATLAQQDKIYPPVCLEGPRNL